MVNGWIMRVADPPQLHAKLAFHTPPDRVAFPNIVSHGPPASCRMTEDDAGQKSGSSTSTCPLTVVLETDPILRTTALDTSTATSATGGDPGTGQRVTILTSSSPPNVTSGSFAPAQNSFVQPVADPS